jgi:flap endonuclease-1
MTKCLSSRAAEKAAAEAAQSESEEEEEEPAPTSDVERPDESDNEGDEKPKPKPKPKKKGKGRGKAKGGMQIPEEWPWEDAKKVFMKPDVLPANEVEVSHYPVFSCPTCFIL